MDISALTAGRQMRQMRPGSSGGRGSNILQQKLDIAQKADDLGAGFVVDLSSEDERAREQELQSMLNKIHRFAEQMEEARRAGDEASEFWRLQIKAMRIARRIINGDNVPVRDHRFLVEQNPGLYKTAVSLRRRNEDPKDYDALSGCDDRDVIRASTQDMARQLLSANTGSPYSE